MKKFKELSKNTQMLIHTLLLDIANLRRGPEGYISDADAIDEIECESRPGFIVSNMNKGGLVYKNFTDLASYNSHNDPAHKGAAKNIRKQLDYMVDLLQENVFEKFKELFKANKIKTHKKLSYSLIDDLVAKNSQFIEVLEYYENIEPEFLSSEDCSIMHEFRFMYHGKNEAGKHMASVSAALNTEGPYHRQSIPWAAGVFCEGAKEIEITWTNNKDLKVKLEKALKKVSKEIF